MKHLLFSAAWLPLVLFAVACNNNQIDPNFHTGPPGTGGGTTGTLAGLSAPTGVPGTPGVCAVPSWNAPATSCTGNILASGSMNNSDNPLDAAFNCEHAGVVGSCCMFHLYGVGMWYLTDGVPQPVGRVCDASSSEMCLAGGACSGGGPAGASFSVTGTTSQVSVSPSLPHTISAFTTLTFTASAYPGYQVIPTVGGTCPAGTWNGTSYTLSAIPGSCTVSFSAVQQGSPGTCSVGAWSSPQTSCTGTIVATGSMNGSDNPADASTYCQNAGVVGSCCMFHLYGAGAWFLTDGQPQSGGRVCDPVTGLSCLAGGSCH